MVFLRSRSNTNNTKTVVITVNLPEDIQLLEPIEDSDLYSVTKSVSSTNTEERRYGSRLLQIFSFLRGSQTEKDDDDGSTHKNTSSDGSLSSSCQVDSLHEEMEGTFSEIIVRSKSTENDFSNSYSSHGFDDRDDLLDEEKQGDTINIKEDDREKNVSDECNDIEQDVKSEKLQTPHAIPTYKSSFTKNELPVNKLQIVTKSKPLSLKELRRTASNGSKNYVHVFHNQLKPLVEKLSEDNYENEETVSYLDNNSDIIQRPSFSASFDETEIRKRWTLSLEVMSKWGLAS